MTALVYDMRMTEHKNLFQSHPERPSRVTRPIRLLKDSGTLARVRVVPSREVTKEEVLWCHKEELWDKLQNLPNMSPTELYCFGAQHDSLYACNESFQSAKLSAGSLLSVTEEVLSGRVRYAIIRTPICIFIY